jgi:type II restriction/modification system DNA methylase subunit YeeA
VQTSLTYRTNRDLFSNYYLDEHLPETEEWDAISEDELQDAYDDITDLWEREKSTAPKRNESQLEEKFIRPMFRMLGIPFEVEESTDRTQRRPDYGFFDSEEAARDAFDRREEGGDFYENSVAVADAKRWGRPLDTRGSGEHERDFENPSYQIHVYLQETPARWAVLTDGKKWRLYYAPTSHPLDSYYEIDLPTVLEKGDLEDFKYFYLFFRHEAFLEDAGGDSFLDDVYDESNVFAQELGEDLQDNIYEAIKVLSEGFLQYPDNDLDEDDLDLIHDSSLIYLYRLIFVLYAESEGRDLLNTSNEIYEQSYSLNSLKQEVAEELDSANPKYHDWQDNLRSRLDELFMLIDQGSKSRGIPEADLHIPAYNGGLFRTDPGEDDSREAQFIANHEVGDAYLAKVIELLTRSENGNGGGKIFVDYSSLDVRHLGSIYEGLLEYQLNVADEPLALNDAEYVIPGEDDEVVVETGEVYLTTGSGERKATGSYYTPEYVVEYIVENTLEPLVTDVREDLVGQSAFGEDRGFAEEFAERVFDLKILDPAMGSGHFLTSAVDYLAREIIDAQEKQAAQQGIETVDKDRDINWARRQVAQRCIYGVDTNPLAVELAKVSLWLRTLAAEQPLAFLDHHLKTGNSLVGSDIEEIEELESESGGDGQNASLADFGIARKGTIEQLMRIYQDFIAIENQELADVKEMEAKYDEFERNKLRQRLEGLANVHTAKRFGLDNLPDDVYARMASALESDEEWQSIRNTSWYQSAQQWKDETHYFHWKLEFPEVYYDLDGSTDSNPGFDAILGNPPYFRMNTLPKSYTEALSSLFPETYQGGADVLTLFVSQAIEHARDGGTIGYIISRYFLESTTAEATRERILDRCSVERIVDFEGMQPFQSVSIQAIIPILRVNDKNDQLTSVIRLTDDDAPYRMVEAELTDHSSNLFQRYESRIHKVGDANSWTFYSPPVQSLLDSMQEKGASLDSIAEVAKSMESGRSSVLVVSPDEIREYDLEERLLEPIVKSGDVRRYYLEENDDRLLWTEGIDIDEYPNTKRYLKPHKDDLASRYDVEARNAPWWYISNPRNANLFLDETTRILTPYMSPENRFYVDEEGYLNDGGDLRGIFPRRDASYSPYYLVAVLNSRPGEYYHHRTSKRKDAGKYEYFGNVLNQFPIPPVDFPGSDGASERQIRTVERYVEGEATKNELSTEEFTPRVRHDVISRLAELMTELSKEVQNINLNLLDYIGGYSSGKTLLELPEYQPAKDVHESVLSETSLSRDNLRIGRANVETSNNRVTIALTARYKPEDEESVETDRWGYAETEPIPAAEFVGIDTATEHLLVEFVDHAINEADDGFANFRSNATQSKSLLDRLSALTLPRFDDVRTGLSTFVERKERAEELNAKRRRADQLVDSLVCDQFGLTEEEREVIEAAYSDGN